jgi:predicted fused transcriptional regulator/phosphomethylpyrimidine kinase|tara:strand:- start:710 stop:1552 length:843 start_codon:yes stop_codon:yes gene_type:complete
MLGSDGSAWLERLHMQLARNLKSSGWSQAEIADILGSTQSTISRMAHRELPIMAGTSDESTIDGWAHEISLALRQLGPGAKPSRTRFVMEVAFAPGQVLRFDKSLTGTDLDSDQEQTALLKRLEWAVSRIDVNRLKPLMPAVGMNIACCLESSRSAAEIAAFPGKLSIVGNKLRHHETPSFGASNYLANILLDARVHDNSKTAILNIHPGDNLEKIELICEELDLNLTFATKGELTPHQGIDIILDEGSFGWVPALYILAHNPLELVDRMHQIITHINSK